MKHLIIILICACLCFFSFLNGFKLGRESLPDADNVIQAADTLGKRDMLMDELEHKPAKPNPGIKAALKEEDSAVVSPVFGLGCLLGGVGH